jgi:hypothetical protein
LRSELLVDAPWFVFRRCRGLTNHFIIINYFDLLGNVDRRCKLRSDTVF